MYERKTLASGRNVEIRPLSWDEFWEFGRLRLEASTSKEPMAVMTASREARERALSACVKGWDGMRSGISLPEVVELEQLINKLSEGPVLSGNSLPAADGQPAAGE